MPSLLGLNSDQLSFRRMVTIGPIASQGIVKTLFFVFC